ncbi:Fpg/Nei family DNA glycosylase [Streptomyces sp. SID3343]|uniref:Fpg/Nei family DNA glycosylase n=1 Tax=Streptomyces sp. SID3343 TaxID=2690260 RepID=UPI001368D0AE|nr:Fpg/Nei family DNA glycosylase [Streptomyces sp. SID3343]MYW04392.1 DNA glycosylase [Streptomyces sp. SID3343]
MPEGDSVYQAARRLRAALVDRPLTVTDFRVPRLATVDLTGRSVLAVVPRGKHLLTRFEGDVTLHTHLRMDGTWEIHRTGSRPLPRPTHAIRLILANAERTAVGMRMPVVELLPTAEESSVVGHLGPDLLGPDWDPAEAVRRLARRPDRPIGDALLDQRNLAGIGNVYKAELCFLRGAAPWTPVAAVGDLGPWVTLAHRLLYANRDRFGHITTGDTRPGRRHWVYGRGGQPCARCRTPIRRADLGDPPRVTYWCPRCQPSPDGATPSDPKAGGSSYRA